MIFKTRTSVYKLEQEHETFILTKTNILKDRGSSVPVGKKDEGNKVLIKDGQLFLHQSEYMVAKTSAITEIIEA
tara:strand:- start:49 stop:270 length:222 start_codon:yes stop_codon:yes gene_type:complete